MNNRDYNILVNKNNPLPFTYVPNDLIRIPNEYDFVFPMKVSLVVYDSFLKLRDVIKNKGIHLCINSAYRSYGLQQIYWHGYALKNGSDYANKYVAKPGTSEHQTGLCIDIAKVVNGKVVNLDKKEYQILEEIAPKFNLIKRYQKEKEAITGIKNEDWHYRYLTEDVINEMLDNNYSLEEYYKEKVKVR